LPYIDGATTISGVDVLKYLRFTFPAAYAGLFVVGFRIGERSRKCAIARKPFQINPVHPYFNRTETVIQKQLAALWLSRLSERDNSVSVAIESGVTARKRRYKSANPWQALNIHKTRKTAGFVDRSSPSLSPHLHLFQPSGATNTYVGATFNAARTAH